MKEQLICPECGKTFTRPASLGAHRARAHGVAGSSAQARAKRERGSKTRGTSRKLSTGAAARADGTGAAASGAGQPDESRRGDVGKASVDRDALLRALFPNGIPARESVVRELNAWLNQAERLASLD